MGIRKHRQKGSLKPLSPELYAEVCRDHETRQLRLPSGHQQTLLEWDDITGQK